MGRSKRQKTTTKAARSLVPVVEATNPAVPGEWDYLPPEIREIILKKVDGRKELLSCRRVNSAWKDVADATLENQCLSQWTKWIPFADRIIPQPPRYPPVMTLCHVWTGRPGQDLRQKLAWTHASLPPVENPKLGSPFPGNSMHIIMPTASDPWPVFGKNRGQMLKELCVNYGRYLTSVVLSNFTPNFEDLCELLRPMINLQALTLKEVGLNPRSIPRSGDSTENPIILPSFYPSFMQPYSPEDSLPPLPKLTHVKIVSCISSVSQLLLNSYSGQLLSFETGSYIRPCPQPFTKLKQLKLAADIKPNLCFPQLGPSPFPALQNLSVTHTTQHYSWLELITAVNNMPKTLIHVHLDVPIRNEETEETAELAILSNQEVTLPFLKKLGIFFPQNQQRAESMGRWLLPKFPMLELLQLIRYHYDFTDDDLLEDDRNLLDRYYVDHNRIVDKVIAAGGFRDCSKLQKIVVSRGRDNRVIRVLTKNEFQ